MGPAGDSRSRYRRGWWCRRSRRCASEFNASEIQELSNISGAARRHYSGGALLPASPAVALRMWQTPPANCSCVSLRRRRWRPVPPWTRSTCWALSLEELEGIPVDEQLALIRDRLSEVHDPKRSGCSWRRNCWVVQVSGWSVRCRLLPNELDRFKVSSDSRVDRGASGR